MMETIKDSKKIIKENCYNKAYELYGKNLPKKVEERLELEVNSIIKNDFEEIYLICSDLVKKSNEWGYEVGNRASIGNSLVAYLLGITNINPIDYNLPFEIFAGKNYDKIPDINLNFSGEVYNKILQYLQETFGRNKMVSLIHVLENDIQTMLHELEKITNVRSKNIDLKDKDTFSLFLHSNDKTYDGNLKGIPEFGTEFVSNMLEIAKPKNFNDLVCVSALSHGTNTWTNNAEKLIMYDSKKVNEVISNRADLYNYLIEKGIDKNTTFDIVEFIRKGNAERIMKKCDNDKYAILKEKWEEYKKIMVEHGIPKWYIGCAERIKYMFPKAHAISHTMNAFKIAWYKVHYPEAFYKAYFNMNEENINVCKKIYNMSEASKEKYFETHTCIYKKIDKKDIVQTETNFDDVLYVLTKTGEVFKTEICYDKIEKMDENIKKLYMLDGVHLYKITNENIILPIEDMKIWDNTDKYLNNNNCKYKKIETSILHIVLLTNEGNVRALSGGYTNLGIIPENFQDVDDISIVVSEDEIDMPYIYKNQEFKKLYIQ